MSPSATSAPTLARAAATAHLVLPGGFLKDPKLPPRGGQGRGVTSDPVEGRRESQRKGAIWQHLCRQVARGLWPLAVKLLKWGRVHSDSSAYQVRGVGEPPLISSQGSWHSSCWGWQNALTRLFGLLPILRRYLANMEEGMEGAGGGEWVADLLRWGRVEEVWVRQAWAPAVIAMCAEMRREGGEFSGEATAVVEELVMPGANPKPYTLNLESSIAVRKH